MMLVIPVLIFPIILNVFVSISSSFTEEAAQKSLKVGVVGSANNYFIGKFMALPEEAGKKDIIFLKDTAQINELIEQDSLDLALIFPSTFDSSFIKMQPATINMYFDATDVGIDERARNYVNQIESIAKQERYMDLQIDEQKLIPFQVNYVNVASKKEMIGKLAGGILPYVFIAFGFIGCMYPAIDLFTGEKERGTIETLLTTPVKRWQILFGKMGVVVLSGLLAASAALLGLFLSIEVFHLVENEELLNIIHEVLSGEFVIMLYALLFPLTVFFAGVMIPIAVYAKSFKEAQSIITPLNIVMVLPAMVGFFPGIELDPITAAIPVINIVLATKELIAGTLDFELLLISFSVMLTLAVLAVFVSYKQFDKESNVVM
jgi:sodium transport system permease protein